MPAYLDRCIRLREACERLRIFLGFSVAANGALVFFLVRELIR
jgi:hypothetical protein